MDPVDGQRVRADEALLQRVERRRADIAEHYADRAERELGEALLRPVMDRIGVADVGELGAGGGHRGSAANRWGASNGKAKPPKSPKIGQIFTPSLCSGRLVALPPADRSTLLEFAAGVVCVGAEM